MLKSLAKFIFGFAGKLLITAAVALCALLALRWHRDRPLRSATRTRQLASSFPKVYSSGSTFRSIGAETTAAHRRTASHSADCEPDSVRANSRFQPCRPSPTAPRDRALGSCERCIFALRRDVATFPVVPNEHFTLHCG